MKKLILILMVGSLFMGCALEDSKKISETDLLHKANPDGNYGNEITLEVKHPIGKLLGSPQTYLGEEVLVSGEITEVQGRSWKIHLAEEQGITMNPEDIKITPEDLVEYRINGTGANIYTFGRK